MKDEAAFPREYTSGGNDGMSLRDWFAGQAAGGLCAHPHGPPSWDNIARDAYTVADAMLAARDAGKRGTK